MASRSGIRTASTTRCSATAAHPRARPWRPSTERRSSGRPPRRPPGFAANAANGLGLPPDVDEELRIARRAQSLRDERAQDDLKAHVELQRRGRATGKDPRAIDERLRKNDEHPRFVLEHADFP